MDSLIATLTQTADYAHQVQAPYTRILCLLAKGAVSYSLPVSQIDWIKCWLGTGGKVISLYSNLRKSE